MTPKRKIGLDYIRVFAMCLVIFCHSGCFSLGLNPKWMEFAGVLAVELFFALSGFLVGKTIIQSAAASNPWNRMKAFYINRFFRIVPLYYIVLFVTMGITGKKIPLSCFFFLQNFNHEAVSFLPPAWSLSIEFWFYFLVSACFLFLFKRFKRFTESKAVFLSIGVLYVIFFSLRAYFSFSAACSWDDGIRKQIFLRMDALLLGVLLAAAKRYKKERYQSIASNHLCLLFFVLGIFILYHIYSVYLYNAALDASPICIIAIFTILPVLSCIIVGYMDQFQHFSPQISFLNRLIEKTANLSYSIYLLHLELFWVVSVYFVDSSFSVSWLGFLGTNLLTGLAAMLTYRFIEIPTQQLKGRILTTLGCDQ